jgi:murein endopeptidase
MAVSRQIHRRRRRLWLTGTVLALVAGAVGVAAGAPDRGAAEHDVARSAPAQSIGSLPPAVWQWANGPPPARIAWRTSRALGRANAGRLVRGVQLPAVGPDWFTWDPAEKRSPNRAWRLWGTNRLVRTLLRVVREYRAAHPDAPRVGIGDISRPHGGSFGRRFGGLGHASHQNGLDVDVYYPRRDGRERRPYAPRQVNRALAQDLVDRFVAAGAVYVFVGPRLGLSGRRGIVQELTHHDDHMHVRLRRR